jgi:hypothetical protein
MADNNENLNASDELKDASPASQGKEVIHNGTTIQSTGADALLGIFNAMGEGKSAEEAIPGSAEKKEKEIVDDAEGKESMGAVTETKPKEEEVVVKQDVPKVDANDEDDFSDLKDEDLQPTPLDKPKTQRRIQALLKKVKQVSEIEATTKKELAEKAAKLAELEKKLGGEGGTGSAVMDENVKAQLDELTMYRRRYELESSPELKTKFDAVIETREKDIAQILRDNQAGESLIKEIEQAGGFAAFGRSDKVFKLPNGDSVTAKQVFQRVRDALVDNNPADAVALDAALQDQMKISAEKKRYVEEEKSRAKDYFKQREEQANTQRKAIVEKAEKWLTEVTSKDEDFKDVEIPADAPAEKKKELEAENIYRKQLRDVLKTSLRTTSFDEFMDMAKDATKYYPVKRSLEKATKLIADKDAEITKLREELNKVKGAGSPVLKRGSVSSGKSEAPKGKPAVASLEDAFEKIAAGEDV